MRLNKLIKTIPALILATAVAAVPLAAQSELIKLEATASYYGDEFNGRPTSSGEIFDMNALTAAHKTLPFGTLLEVTNLETAQKVIVRVNDRGPFVGDRELDVSKAAAIQLGMLETGIARVSIRKVGSSDTVTATTARTAAPAMPGATAAATNAAPTEPAATVAPSAIAAATTTPVESAATVAAPNLAEHESETQWRIQLGSFSREENASRLVVRLRKDGFNPAFEKSGTLTRVVLTGIPDSELKITRSRLDTAGYGEYLVRQETW